jgi:hypothetical protein
MVNVGDNGDIANVGVPYGFVHAVLSCALVSILELPEPGALAKNGLPRLPGIDKWCASNVGVAGIGRGVRLSGSGWGGDIFCKCPEGPIPQFAIFIVLKTNTVHFGQKW